jgi:predicted signal transduction protein with EAL and GGDEF domain
MQEPQSLGLVRAIVVMAHELGMETVAEGITSRGQLNDLKALDCDYGQGVLLSRPLGSRGIESFLDRLESNGHRLLAAAPKRRAPRKPVKPDQPVEADSRLAVAGPTC